MSDPVASKSVPSWTQEPWGEFTAIPIRAGDPRLRFTDGLPPSVACRILSEENYQRAVACVNACAGLLPADLRRQRDDALRMLCALVDNIAPEPDPRMEGATDMLTVHEDVYEAARKFLLSVDQLAVRGGRTRGAP